MTEYSVESGEVLPEVDTTAGQPVNGILMIGNDAFAHLPLTAIVPSLTNPRKTFDPVKLNELADSIKASGIHQPVLVRPLPGSRVLETSFEPLPATACFPFPDRKKAARPTHEIVAGERRFRACKIAGVATIPVLIRDLTNHQVLEIQIIENLQRDDLSPLEEAEGYEQLCTATGINKEDVGAKIGKSRAYVYACLKLLDLSSDCKQALRSGSIDKSRALLIARIPDTALQQKAVTEATRKGYNGDVISLRDLQTWLQKNVMLRLEGAPFNTADSQLCKDAGSCKTCPKRTGANPDLFAEVESADICTDPPCYHAKEDAHRAALIKRAEGKGMRIVEGKEALEMMDGRQYMIMPHNYASLTKKRPDLTPEGERPATLRELLGKDAPAPILFIHPRTQEVMELVPDDEAEAVLLAKGLIKADEHQAERLEDLNKDLERLQKRAKVETARAYSTAVSEAVMDHIRATTPEQARALVGPEVLRAWLLNDLDDLGEEHMADVLGYDFQEGEDEMDAITGHIQRMGDTELYRAGALNILDRETCMRSCDAGLGPVLEALVKSVGLDTKPMQRSAANTVRAEYAQRIRDIQDRLDAKKSPLPLAPAAQAKGQGGAQAQSQKTQSPAAPARKKKMSATEAQAAIAAAMQDQDTDSGAAIASQSNDADSSQPVAASGASALALTPEAALSVGAPQHAINGEIDAAQYATATSMVVIQQVASISRLQRMLNIGYNAAARMLERMEAEGIVSPMERGDTRKVLQPSPIDEAVEPLYQSALDLIVRDQKVNVRMLKAELKIGTTKALELVAKLEQAGKVSTCDERGGRKVLVTA